LRAEVSLLRREAQHFSEWLVQKGGVGEQLLCDVAKLGTQAERFEGELDTWFPIDSSETPDATFLRSARHDARNHLNHLFGGTQLIQMTTTEPETLAMAGRIASRLEACLSLVSKAGAEKEPSGASPLPQETATAAATYAHPIALPQVAGHTGRLLVADDDPENREILDRLLSPLGFQLAFAVNGRDAIRQIESEDFDAVLLDIQMPEMDGFQVLAHLHETGHLRHTPVIVVTGLQEEQDAVRCIEIGAEDFLSRPIRSALLMARLNASLEKKRLREKVFEQHFTPELARELARNPDPMKMKARQAEVSLLFCDIRGFSTISERLGPSQTVDWLSGVMGEFSTIVIDHGGVLVDYTGDELLAMWGAPNEQPDHASLACRTAREILASLERLNALWRDLIGAETAVGIGVNTGEALVGNIGTHRKFKYGPLGTCVNVASRVQGATKYFGNSLLLTGETAARLDPAHRTRRLGRVQVQNIAAPIDLHELELPGGTVDWNAWARHYEAALSFFEQEKFGEALAILDHVLAMTPDDGPSLLLSARIAESSARPSDRFSPVWKLPGK
jgi:class 3 adenylate cyclase